MTQKKEWWNNLSRTKPICMKTSFLGEEKKNQEKKEQLVLIT
jgi:hypothetical protein